MIDMFDLLPFGHIVILFLFPDQPSTAVAPPKKFKCQKCNAAFKCKETLDGHNQSYCPMRKQPSISPVTSLASNGPINGVAGGSVVGGNNLSNKNHVRELTSLVAQQSSSGDDLLEKVHQQLSSLENVVMATKTFETQQRLGIIPGPVGNVRKHKCSACGIIFFPLLTRLPNCGRCFRNLTLFFSSNGSSGTTCHARSTVHFGSKLKTR